MLGNALWAALYAGNFGILILASQTGQCQNEDEQAWSGLLIKINCPSSREVDCPLQGSKPSPSSEAKGR
jgi:hypothetical protein